MLIQSTKLGSSIAQTLRIYAAEMREKRRMRAEEKAHRLPVLISIPLVACMLPAMIGVLMLPAAIRVVRAIVPALRREDDHERGELIARLLARRSRRGGLRDVDADGRARRSGQSPMPRQSCRPRARLLADAAAQLALGNVGLALEGFRKALREQPDSADAYAGIANCYEAMGRFDLARTEL